MEILRPLVKQMQTLLDEFKALKKELFGNKLFVVVPDEDSPDWQRYDQLFGFFYPEFRTRDWVSPV